MQQARNVFVFVFVFTYAIALRHSSNSYHPLLAMKEFTGEVNGYAFEFFTKQISFQDHYWNDASLQNVPQPANMSTQNILVWRESLAYFYRMHTQFSLIWMLCVKWCGLLSRMCLVYAWIITLPLLPVERNISLFVHIPKYFLLLSSHSLCFLSVFKVFSVQK